ncbi:hypothetical protein LguiA_034362 [Lonicera macranthoides]
MLGAINGTLNAPADLVLAEALRCCEVLRWLKTAAHSDITVESVSLLLVNALNDNSASATYFSLIVNDCKALAREIFNCSFVKRLANQAAHRLAREAGSSYVPQRWSLSFSIFAGGSSALYFGYSTPFSLVSRCLHPANCVPEKQCNLSRSFANPAPRINSSHCVIVTTVELASGFANFGKFANNPDENRDVLKSYALFRRSHFTYLFVAKMDNVETSECLKSLPNVNFLLNGYGVEEWNNVSVDVGPQIPTVTARLTFGPNLLQLVGQFNGKHHRLGNYIIAFAYISISSSICPTLKDYVPPRTAALNSA